ncbi:hypothetical protein L596_000948 [Steinernema carpocapsae]|uniref:Uncharacterized protein n=1 Tax=Steinernema carpocapsae TaxID=34508 RepID=A0A4U8UJL0_STECR|nr:hypothetical protein L596_000948 [Steinernema carpocapsae]
MRPLSQKTDAAGAAEKNTVGAAVKTIPRAPEKTAAEAAEKTAGAAADTSRPAPVLTPLTVIGRRVFVLRRGQLQAFQREEPHQRGTVESLQPQQEGGWKVPLRQACAKLLLWQALVKARVILAVLSFARSVKARFRKKKQSLEDSAVAAAVVRQMEQERAHIAVSRSQESADEIEQRQRSDAIRRPTQRQQEEPEQRIERLQYARENARVRRFLEEF